MQIAKEIQLKNSADAVPVKKNPNSTSKESLRFKGNLIAYRKEFASIPSANSNNAPRTSKDFLLQRSNAKRARLVSRPIQTLFQSPPPPRLLQEVNRNKRDSRIGAHGRLIAAVIGGAFIGVGVADFWMSTERRSSPAASIPSQSNVMTGQQQTSDSNPSSLTPSDSISEPVTAVGKTSEGGISIEALTQRVVESEKAAAGYREEVALLRHQTSSLTSENEALVTETLGLNRELSDLAATVTALQEEKANDKNVETRVVYNFVNVPIGSDPNTVAGAERYDTAIGGNEVN